MLNISKFQIFIQDSGDYNEDRQSEVIFAAQEAERQEEQEYEQGNDGVIDLFEMNNETGLNYFQERFKKSFTEDDEQFQECLNRKLGNPPIMKNYRIFQHARRNNNRNNFNHNHNNSNYQRRF